MEAKKTKDAQERKKQIAEQLHLLRKEIQRNRKLCEGIEAMFSPILTKKKPQTEKEIRPTQIVPLATDIRDIRFEAETANRVLRSTLERSEL